VGSNPFDEHHLPREPNETDDSIAIPSNIENQLVTNQVGGRKGGLHEILPCDHIHPNMGLYLLE
jgi:hypothetical protein